MTDACTLEHTWGFRPVEIEFVGLLFKLHFNSDRTYGVLLSTHYAQRRPTWVTDFLMVIKAEMSQLPIIDSSAQVFLWGEGDKTYQKVGFAGIELHREHCIWIHNSKWGWKNVRSRLSLGHGGGSDFKAVLNRSMCSKFLNRCINSKVLNRCIYSRLGGPGLLSLNDGAAQRRPIANNEM